MSVYNKLYVKTELFANKVDGTDFTTQDWAFLGTVDQNLAKANDVEFKTLTLNNGTFKTKLQSGANVADYTLTLPIDAGGDGDVLTTDGNGVLSWNTTGGFDQDLNTTGDVTFNGLTVSNDLTVGGNLTVSGTTTIISTTNLEIEDNIIVLNKGETGAGVSGGTAGIEIDRGTDTNQQLLFVEGSDTWTVGLEGGTLGSDVHRLAELADQAQTLGAIPGYDANGRLAEAEGLTAGEVNQLQNIDGTVITATNWQFLSNMDQNVAQTGIVQFEKIINTAGIFMIDKSNIYRNVSTLYTTTAAFDAGGWYSINVFDTTNGPILATLPSASALQPGVSMTPSQSITIVLTAGTNDLTISAAVGDTIEGTASIVLNEAGQHITVMSLGNGNWILV